MRRVRIEVCIAAVIVAVILTWITARLTLPTNAPPPTPASTNAVASLETPPATPSPPPATASPAPTLSPDDAWDAVASGAFTASDARLAATAHTTQEAASLCAQWMQSAAMVPLANLLTAWPDATLRALVSEGARVQSDARAAQAAATDTPQAWADAELWAQGLADMLSDPNLQARAAEFAANKTDCGLFEQVRSDLGVDNLVSATTYAARIPETSAYAPRTRSLLDAKWAQVSQAAEECLAAGNRIDALKNARKALLLRGESDPVTADLMARATAPDYAYLGTTTRADYTYTIGWEPETFDSVRPLDWIRAEPLNDAGRRRMERIIQEFASLYPPDYLNRYLKRILCYGSFSTLRLENGQPALDLGGNRIWDTIYGAMSGGVIIITDGFPSDAAIRDALIHEMAHLEMHYGDMDNAAGAVVLLDDLSRMNPPGFTYYYDQPGILSTDDIPGWRSTDSEADWKAGFARRYGMLSAEEDYTTLTEKLFNSGLTQSGDYPVLQQKLERLMAYRSSLHPSMTREFYAQVLPKYLSR